METRTGRRSAAGETLVELLVAVAILGLAGVAVLAGLMVSIRSSTQHSDEATAGAYVHSFGEAIQRYVDANGLASCASAAATYKAQWASVTDSHTASYTPDVTGLQSWTSSGWSACAADATQRIMLKLTSPGSPSSQSTESMTLTLRRPCSGSAAAVGDDPCA